MRKKWVLELAAQNGEGLTYDDVRLRTGFSEVMPDDVSLISRFSRNVGLNIPIVSAAMDTVTEFKLAIKLAELGGLGVIHRSLSPDEQAYHVARTKHHLNGRVERPITVQEIRTIEEILNMKAQKGYNFNSFPVVDDEDRLVGIITGNDLIFCDNISLTARDVMTPTPLTASVETTMQQAYDLMRRQKKKALPLINSERRIQGMYIFSDVKRILNGEARHFNVDPRGQLRVGAAIGVREDAFERVEKLVRENVDVVVIDTAHADSSSVYETLKELKSRFPSLDVVVGNISEADSAKKLAEAGADGIKVGQGPGSICTTRIIAGIGCPQVSAVYECAKVADDYDIPICADGGLRYSGDIPIAIAAGAHSVMMGSMLAGVDESPGEIVFVQGRQWKSYRGMGSLGAMSENASSRERYLQIDSGKDKLVPEGVEGLVSCKGKLTVVMHQYVGGLRRGMGYVGAASIEELREKGEFRRITSAGVAESHPHDMTITKEAPNYRTREQ
jgi:IMP dehydrogenase